MKLYAKMVTLEHKGHKARAWGLFDSRTARMALTVYPSLSRLMDRVHSPPGQRP